MTEQQNNSTDKFRDSIATADKEGHRIWVFPSKPKGRLYKARGILSVFLLAFLFAAPFIKVGGHQFLLFDIIERRFVIFGLVFWPQDFYIFVLGAITLAVFIVLFTAIFGRLFCGWICPQTIFMEMVFRRIEYRIDGGPAQQKKLRAAPWGPKKIGKRVAKHGIFYAISFLIGNIFLAYIIGSDELIEIITDPPSEHVAGLTAMILFSLVFYWVFSWFREQVCTIVCPYGRLQGVLIDQNSIVVAYDYQRGEPRAPMARGDRTRTAGDCVECGQCVTVCPTGIDIRNGTQLECVNCTACIDACNRTMRRVGLPEGLIRYSSENAIARGERFKFTGRIGIYSGLLTVLVAVLGVLLLLRTPIDATILRTPGTMYQKTDEGIIRNLYSVKVFNKTMDPKPVEFRLAAPSAGSISLVGGQIVIPPDSLRETALFVDIPADRVFSASTLISIEVVSDGEVVETIRTSFSGPQPDQKTEEGTSR